MVARSLHVLFVNLEILSRFCVLLWTVFSRIYICATSLTLNCGHLNRLVLLLLNILARILDSKQSENVLLLCLYLSWIISNWCSILIDLKSNWVHAYDTNNLRTLVLLFVDYGLIRNSSCVQVGVFTVTPLFGNEPSWTPKLLRSENHYLCRNQSKHSKTSQIVLFHF